MNQTVSIENVLRFANSSLRSFQRRHTTYVSHSDLAACHRRIDASDNDSDACPFVKHTDSCYDFVNIFNYLKFMTCDLKLQTDIKGFVLIVCILVVVVFVYAVFLYMISAYFILPNVIHVAQYVHVSLYDYGLTTIAVIISAPEVLWVLQKCEEYSQNGTLIMAHMLGKAFTTFTVGLAVICLRGQTHLPGLEFTRHTFIALAAFVISASMIHIKFVNDRSDAKDQYNFNMRAVAFSYTVIYVANIAYQILSKRRFDRSIHVYRMSTVRFSTVFEQRSGWSQFWHALNAFEHMRLPKWAIAFFAPFWTLAALQIPVIDKERPMYGWCKYLTCLNFLIFPWQTYFLKNTHSLTFTLAILFFATICAILTMVFTKTRELPKNQGFFAIAGIIMGLLTYHIVGCELETIIYQVCSFVFDAPSDIIMLTGFVLNYLLNVSIFGYELVKRGFGNLACGLVVGIVLNQAFMSLPIVTHQYCSKIQNFIVLSANSVTCLVFMVVFFLMIMFALSITNFELRLCHGIYIFILYGIFLLYLCLSYMEAMHPYGAYHTVSADLQREFAEWA